MPQPPSSAENINLTNTVCLVCGQVTFKSLCNNILVKCLNCSFISANMQLSPEEIRKIYSENYFTGEEYEDYLRDKAVLQKNFSNRLKKIYSVFPSIKITNALEIGCAYGFFGELLKKNLNHVYYKGFDVTEEAIAYGKENFNLDVSTQNYLDYKTDQKFTDVFMWDVIEHLMNPEKFLEKINRDSAPGARLFITTGDIGALLAKTQKCRWRMIHPPSHLQYFSKETITLLLKKNGFTVKKVFYPPASRSAKVIFYSLFMLRKNYPQWVEKIYKSIPDTLYITINTFDIMFVIAVKD